MFLLARYSVWNIFNVYLYYTRHFYPSLSDRSNEKTLTNILLDSLDHLPEVFFHPLGSQLISPSSTIIVADGASKNHFHFAVNLSVVTSTTEGSIGGGYVSPLSLCLVCLFVVVFSVYKIYQNVMHRLGLNLVNRLGVLQKRIALIWGKIQIQPVSGIQNVNCSACQRYTVYRVPVVVCFG